jgi:hypothetical protein
VGSRMPSLGSKILMLMTARTYCSCIQVKHFRFNSLTLWPTATSQTIRACGFPYINHNIKITYKTIYNNTQQTQHTHISPGGRGITAEMAGLGTNATSGLTVISGAISTPFPPGI